MLEFRRLFGREIARIAAFRATKDGLSRIVAIADKADAASTAAELFELDFDFYVALTALTANHVMVLLINTVRDAVRSFIPLLANLAGSPELVRRHHRELLAAIEAHDPEAAARIADEYLRTGAELAGRISGRSELVPLPLPG